MQYIKLTLIHQDPTWLEELIEEHVVSIFIKGVDGHQQQNDDILKLSFSQWELLIIPKYNSNDTLEVLHHNLAICNIQEYKIEIIVDNTNYLINNQQTTITQIGEFLVTNHLDHLPTIKSSTNTIYIPASMAFGTGEHATTKLCGQLLTMIDHYQSYHHTTKVNVLDLGTGSGILATLAAKMLPQANILATDIDPDALTVAQQVINHNQVSQQINLLLSNGFEKIANTFNFDIIIANIVLNPLLTLIDDIYQYLNYNGIVILSGFLIHQRALIKDKYLNKDFKLLKELTQNEWCALMFIKNNVHHH